MKFFELLFGIERKRQMRMEFQSAIVSRWQLLACLAVAVRQLAGSTVLLAPGHAAERVAELALELEKL